MSTASLTIPANERTRGRGWLWFGLLLCLVGPVLVAAQFFGLKLAVVPWYSPALAAGGALLVLLSACRRPTIPRVFFFVLAAAFAGFQWHFLATLMQLPHYNGPIEPGETIPPFTGVTADGKPITEVDLRDGTRRAIVFFRGRW